MMLTCQELFKSTKHPKINKITLDLLREFYETYLHPYVYQYKVVDDSGEKPVGRTIELRFDQENLCHLLGLESIVRYNVKDTGPYKAQDGWDNIKNGILDIAALKVINTGKFKSNKSKLVFFYLVPRLLDSPKGVFFDPDKVAGDTRIECELLFYDRFLNSYIHLGIERTEKGYYIGRTFLVKKVTNQNEGKKYIENQQPISVKKIAKEEISSV